MPLLVTLPFTAAAKSVQIVRDGKVLTQVSVGQKLLRDAINAIPGFGFARNAAHLRKALQNDVDTLQKMLESGNSHGALQKLTHDLRPKVQRWIIDGYIKGTPVQLEKTEVLMVIDRVIEQVRQQYQAGNSRSNLLMFLARLRGD